MIPFVVGQKCLVVSSPAKLETFLISYFGTDVNEICSTKLHRIDVSWSVLAPSGYYHKVRHREVTLACFMTLSQGFINSATMAIEKGHPCGKEARSWCGLPMVCPIWNLTSNYVDNIFHVIRLLRCGQAYPLLWLVCTLMVYRAGQNTCRRRWIQPSTFIDNAS